MSTPQDGSVLSSPRKEMILAELKTIVNKLTGMHTDSIDVHTSFLEVGIDSLLLIQATQQIQDVFAAKLSVVQLLEEHDTLARVATYLDQQLPVEAPPPPGIRTDKEEFLSTSPTARAAEAPVEAQALTSPAGREDQRTYSNLADAGVPADTPSARAITSTLVHSAVRPSESPRKGSGNGGGPKPASIAFTGDASALKHIMSQQLQVMSQQLEMLRGNGAPDVEATTGVNETTGVDAALETRAAAQEIESPPAANGANQAVAAFPPVPAAEVLPDASDNPPILEPKPVTAGSLTIRPEMYVPYQPIDKSAANGLTPRQQQHLDELTKSYTARTRESKRMTQTYRPFLADSRVSAGYRTLWKEMVYPIVGQRSQGSRMWDVDGNEYVDVTMGFGLHLFGHSPAFIIKAIESQLKQGIHLGPQSNLAGKVAQLISELTGVERVNFCNSGTEAVMGALRVARTVTRRNKIALFGGGYHGWSDGTLVRPIGSNGVQKTVPMAPGVPPLSVQDTMVLEWDSPNSLEFLRAHGHELAAVITEPVQSRRPDIQPREFLHELRKLTEQSGTALILDEMVTGFRIQPGGAQAHFGVTADLVIYGKVLGGGLPIGVVAGKAAFMDAFDGGMWNYEDNSYPRAEKTLFTGAYFKHPLAMSVAEAILTHMKNGGRDEIERLNERTSRLVGALNEFFDDQQIPIRAANFGSLFRLLVSREFKYADVLFYHLVENGIFVWEGRNCFLSAAHTEEDADLIVSAVKRSVLQTREGGFLPDAPSPRPIGGGPMKKSEITSAGLSLETAGSNGSCAATAPPIALEPPPPSGAAVTNPTEPAGCLAGRERPAAGSAIVTEPATARSLISVPRTDTGMDFSLYFFGNYRREFDEAKYDLIFKSAKYADRNGFAAIWIPERHFNSFGGFSPNPSVLASALARETERIQLRAGSCVVPLHNPIRIAEEWAVVDNLSKGRVGISFASGWHPNDFVFSPDAYQNRREVMYEGIEIIRKLWRGEAIQAREGKGDQVSIRISPLPKQPELPFWLTSVRTSTAIEAAKLGGGFLTNLQDQTVEELAVTIRLYREALERNGFDPKSGHVTLLLHTYITDDLSKAIRKSRDPFLGYLKSSMSLALRKKAQVAPADIEAMSEKDLEYILSGGFSRYLQVGSLIGTPETCTALVERLAAIGVNEIGCLIDWGVDTDSVLESLIYVNDLRQKFQLRNAGGLEDKASVAVALASTNERSVGAYSVPLTKALRELWMATQMGDDASRAYNECIVLRLRGSLDLQAIRNALQKLVDRHEALRATFSPDGDCQWILPAVEVKVPLVDFSEEDVSTREASAKQWIKREINRPFDLVHGPLARFHVLALKDDEHLLLIANHHLILDGHSWMVLMKDFHALYAAERQGVACELPPPIPFSEYVKRQQLIQENPQMAEQEAYWLAQFSDGAPVLELPADRPRPLIQTYNGDQQPLAFDRSLTRALKKMCVQQRSTMLMLLLTAYSVLLHRLSGQDDIIVGIASAGQLALGDKNIVGYCLNMLPLRSKITGDTTFSNHLRSMKRLLLEGYEHQNYSFSNLIGKLNLRGDPSRSPLFTAAFDLERNGPAVRFHDLELEVLPKPTAMARFDIHFVFTETADDLILQCTYNTDLFDVETIRRWMGHFHTLLESVAAAPEQRLSQAALLTKSQQQEMLVECNGTAAAEYPANESLHELFEAQVERTPDAIAVTYEGTGLSYRELNRKANRVAHRLRSLGIGPESRVGILMERSIEMVAGLLGILKAGGAYVPLDPAYPEERLSFVMEDAGIEALVTQKDLSSLPRVKADLIFLDGGSDVIDNQSDDNLSSGVVADNLAYIIYTSGSTGRPKGVAVCHQQVVRLFSATGQWYGFDNRDVWTLFHSYAFDFSVWEIWGALLHGGRLVIVPYLISRSPQSFHQLLCSERVTVLNQTPSAFRQLVQAEQDPSVDSALDLRFVIFGGEALDLRSLKPWFERHGDQRPQLINMYGITETTVHVTYRPLTVIDSEREGGSFIGRAIPDLQLYLADGQMQLAPIEVPGEIYVGGEGVARGYFNNPILTAERFVPSAFSQRPGARLYKSGDLGRRTPGGDINYVGRMDEQVKIRGYRIELAEIEAALCAHPAITQAMVIARDFDNDERILVAYLLTGAQDAPGVRDLRSFLEQKLPDYMIPSAFVELEKLPMTSSGKVDRRALPDPTGERRVAGQDFAPPGTPVEEMLCSIWSEVLQLKRVGIHDRFLDLGGHSLLAIQVISRIREAFGVKINIRVLFESPTIAGLAAVIVDRQGAEGDDSDRINNVAGPEVSEILENIERLSEREVDVLLTSMLAAEETR